MKEIVFYDPGSVVKAIGGGIGNIFSPNVPRFSLPAGSGRAEAGAAEEAAAGDAARRARASAAARTGRRTTLLTGAGVSGQGAIQTAKRTLLGSSAA